MGGRDYCVAAGCCNRRDRCIYRFPADSEVRREWVRRVNRKAFTVGSLTANSRLCSKHFSGGRKKCLRHLPTIFSHETYKKEWTRRSLVKRESHRQPERKRANHQCPVIEQPESVAIDTGVSDSDHAELFTTCSPGSAGRQDGSELVGPMVLSTAATFARPGAGVTNMEDGQWGEHNYASMDNMLELRRQLRELQEQNRALERGMRSSPGS